MLLVNASSCYSLWKVGDKTCYANLYETIDHLVIVDGIRVKFEPQVDLPFELINRNTGIAWIKGIEKWVAKVHRILRKESQDSLHFKIRPAPLGVTVQSDKAKAVRCVRRESRPSIEGNNTGSYGSFGRLLSSAAR